MQTQALHYDNEITFFDKSVKVRSSLNSMADDVLIAIATLGLVATVVDGEADRREVEVFTREFRKRFALSRRHSLKLIAAALARITVSKEADVIDCACDTLNEHLNFTQKIQLLNGLVQILVADGQIHEEEDYFLDYIAWRLDLESLLKETDVQENPQH